MKEKIIWRTFTTLAWFACRWKLRSSSNCIARKTEHVRCQQWRSGHLHVWTGFYVQRRTDDSKRFMRRRQMVDDGDLVRRWAATISYVFSRELRSMFHESAAVTYLQPPVVDGSKVFDHFRKFRAVSRERRVQKTWRRESDIIPYTYLMNSNDMTHENCHECHRIGMLYFSSKLDRYLLSEHWQTKETYDNKTWYSATD